MAELDRSALIALLRQLGAASDEEALGAARAIDQAVREAGEDWDMILRPALNRDEGPEEVPSGGPTADPGEDARTIDRLLAKDDLSEMTREELAGLKTDIAEGSFSAMDSRYVRALAKRLGV